MIGSRLQGCPGRRRLLTIAALAVALLAALADRQIAHADRMFSLTSASAQNQTTQIGTTFAEAPLVRVCVVGSSPCVPVDGIAVTFAAPAGGASGTFATTGTNTVTVTSLASGFATAPAFTANSIAGSYVMRVAAFEPDCGPDPGGGNNPQWCAVPNFFFFTNSAGPATLATLISTGDGSNQAAQINTAFAIQLSAIVFNGSNQPLPGITVTFGAPSSGTSGTFAGTGTNTTTVVTDATGLATAGVFTANGTDGSYTVTATVSGSQTVSGESISTSFALRNTLHNPDGVPDLVSAAAGNNQQTPVLTAFPTNLQVVVLDGSLSHVEGAEVIFTAPNSGPSGTFAGGSTTFTTTSGPTGLATATTFTANAFAGPYSVGVTATKNGVSATGVIGLTNGRVMTTTTLTIDPPAGAVFGQPVEISTTVQPVSGTLVPAGPVTFRSNGAAIGGCTSVNPVGGVATCTLTALTPGDYSFSADYAGDAVSQPSSSAVPSYTVDKAGTTTAITSDMPDPSGVGQAYTVQWSVTVISPGAGTPTGSVTVTVSDGGETCMATVAAGSCTVTSATAGMKTITATYSGDSSFNASMGSAPHTVTDLAVLTITKGVSPDPVAAGQDITYTMIATNTGPTAAQDLTITDMLPPNTTFVSATAAGGVCTTPAVGGTGTVTCVWTGGTAPGIANARTLTLVVRVNPSAANGTTISNTAAVSAPNSDPNTGNSSAAATTIVISVPAPTVSGITPASGPTAGGTIVTITGSGFQQGATVTFGGVPATMVTVISATEIRAITPPHAPGPVAVSVTVPGVGTIALPNAFTYLAALSIAGLSPDRGPEAGGTSVTITGQGFVPGQTSVAFGLTPAQRVNCASSTQCQAVSPPGTGSVGVSVTVDGQASPDSAAARFTYEPPLPPPPQPMTLTGQVWRQIPPLVSENQIEGTLVPVGGATVEALVGGAVCGQGVTDSQGRFALTVAADPPAPGCGRPGLALTFRVNGQTAASDPFHFQSGGQASVTLRLPGPMPPPRR